MTLPPGSIAKSVLSHGGSAASRELHLDAVPEVEQSEQVFAGDGAQRTFSPQNTILQESGDELAFHQVGVALALAHYGPPVSPDEDLGGAGAGVVVGGHREAIGAGAHDG
jgi:hypothetical protein